LGERLVSLSRRFSAWFAGAVDLNCPRVLDYLT